MALRGKRPITVNSETQEQSFKHGSHGVVIEEENRTLNNQIKQVRERKTKAKSGVTIKNINSKRTPYEPKIFLGLEDTFQNKENTNLNDIQRQNFRNETDLSKDAMPRTSKSIDSIVNVDLSAKKIVFDKNNDFYEHIKADKKMTETLNNQIQELQKYICSKSTGNSQVNSNTSVLSFDDPKTNERNNLVMILP